MNEPTLDVRPEVSAFVDLVRSRLRDLDDEVRDELTDGLEADLGDLVAERGVEALPDPDAYAEELRVSAGLPVRERRGLRRPRGSLRKPGQTWVQTIDAWLDGGRDRWFAWASAGPRAGVWEIAQAMRPAWWVLRAWLLVAAADQLTGPWELIDVVPQFGVPLLGPVLLLAATVASVQIGRGAWWPGTTGAGSSHSRWLLLAVNAAAIAVLPLISQAADEVGYYSPSFDAGYGCCRGPERQPGLVHDGRTVRNVYAYDASGHPLQGVQLFDQNGDPLTVAPSEARGQEPGGWWVAYPWVNGSKELWNVFPLPTRQQPRPARSDLAWGEPDRPSIDTSPMAGTAQATLPGDGPASTPSSSAPSGPTDSEKPTPR